VRRRPGGVERGTGFVPFVGQTPPRQSLPFHRQTLLNFSSTRPRARLPIRPAPGQPTILSEVIYTARTTRQRPPAKPEAWNYEWLKKPNGPSSNRRTPRQRVSCGAAPRFLSPHPGPLPGERVNHSPARRTIQRGRFSTAGSSLLSQRERGRVRGNGASSIPRIGSITEPSNSETSGKAGGFPRWL